MMIELESVKTRISAPAHPSAAGIGRVSGLVCLFPRKIGPFLSSDAIFVTIYALTIHFISFLPRNRL